MAAGRGAWRHNSKRYSAAVTKPERHADAAGDTLPAGDPVHGWLRGGIGHRTCSSASNSSAAFKTSSGSDSEQAGFGCFVAGVIAAALRASQHPEPGAEWAVAAGIGGTVDADHGPAKSAGQVERPGIAGDGDGHATGNGDQLAEVAGKQRWRRRPGLLARWHSSSGSSPGPRVDQNAKAALQQPLRYGCIPLDRPTLGAPAGTGIDEGRRADAPVGERRRRRTMFGGRIDGQQRRTAARVVARNGRCQFDVLLDDMRAVRCQHVR